MVFPLNINLLIPFKDNKGRRLDLYRNEIETFKKSLEHRADELRGEVGDLFGSEFELTIAGRSDGNAKKYYWRFKSSKRDRKFSRLHVESVSSYLAPFDRERKLWLREVEQELIYINANLKLIKGMLDSIEQCVSELDSLHESEF